MARPLIVDLATKILAQYSGPMASAVGVAGDLLLNQGDMENALEELEKQGYIKTLLKLVGASSTASDALAELVIDAIKKVQANTGDHLESDGILGQRTLKWLTTHAFGHYDDPKSSLKPSTTSSSPKNSEHVIRYFIVDGLPPIPGVSSIGVVSLLNEVWERWQNVCRLKVEFARNADEANVIVEYKVIDGAGSVLAMADVGPPGGSQLRLTFDKGEPQWTVKKFQGTAMHEIGHLLGLHHSSVPGQVMNDTLQEEILAPMADDIAKVTAIWDNPPPTV